MVLLLAVGVEEEQQGGNSKAGLQKQTVGIAASVLEAFRMWYTGSLGKVTE